MRFEENTDVLYLHKELAVNLSSVENLGEALNCIIKSVSNNSGLDCGGIYISDADKGSLTLAASKGLPDEFLRISSFYPADSKQVKMAKMGIPLYISFKEHLNKVDRHENVLENEGLKSIAILPVIYKGSLIAVLNLGSHSKWEIDKFTQYILESIPINIADSTLIGI